MTEQPYRWEFRARFRRHAFGWRSQPAVQRVKQAVSEVKAVARRDQMLGAEGAGLFLERVSPALEQVDSSSGAIGTAIYHAIEAFVPIIATAPADGKTRQAWFNRLWASHEADEIPYIEALADHWGGLCTSKEVASHWSDELVGITRMALSPDPKLHGHFHGTSACLGALYAAERHDEIVDILQVNAIWPYKRWAVKALAAVGKKAEAIRYAESRRSPWASDHEIDSMCEDILLSSGLVEEAYERYGLRANRGGTYLATFRAVGKKYPQKSPRELLADLVGTTPGSNAKWFAAAKEAGLYDEAVRLASTGACDPKTLTRAARDFAEKEPAFSLEVGILARRWLTEGYGYDVTSADVRSVFTYTMKAASNHGCPDETLKRLREIVGGEEAGGFVKTALLTRVDLLSLPDKADERGPIIDALTGPDEEGRFGSIDVAFLSHVVGVPCPLGLVEDDDVRVRFATVAQPVRLDEGVKVPNEHSALERVLQHCHERPVPREKRCLSIYTRSLVHEAQSDESLASARYPSNERQHALTVYRRAFSKTAKKVNSLRNAFRYRRVEVRERFVKEDATSRLDESGER